MTDDIPGVAPMVEESERGIYIYCDNEHFDDVGNCHHIRDIQSNIRISREGTDMWDCVLGPRQDTVGLIQLPNHGESCYATDKGRLNSFFADATTCYF